jgi:hypothetical protein
MMKRLTAAGSAVGLLTVGVLGTSSATAGATAARTVAPLVNLSRSVNLVPTTSTTTSYIRVNGSGWATGTSLAIAECNADAAIKSDLTACNLHTTPSFLSVPVSATGQFSVAKFPLSKAGVVGNDPLSSCPVSAKQASTGVQCIIGVLDLTTDQAIFVPIHFAAPVPKWKVTKVGTTHYVSLTETGAYAATATKGVYNSGFGYYGQSTTGSQICQGNSTGTATWTANGTSLPLCTKTIGEIVKATTGLGELLAQFRVDVGATTTGDFSVKFKIPSTLQEIILTGLKTGTLVKVPAKG